LTWYRKSKCWCLLLLFFESYAQVCHIPWCWFAKRAPKAQITDYDREYLSKLLEQSTANAQEATEQANKLEIQISKYNAVNNCHRCLWW
jgi:hypothetical protein